MSKPNWGRQLALAVTLVVLGSVSYWLVYNHKVKDDEQEEQSKKIAQISPEKNPEKSPEKSKDAQIQTITLDDGAGKRLSVNCLDTALKICKPGSSPKWEMTEPLKVK